MASTKKKWVLPGDGRGGFLYHPYWLFGPGYCVPDEAAHDQLRTRLQTVGILQISIVTLLRFLPNTFWGLPVGLMILFHYAVLWCLLYAITVRICVRKLVIVQPKLPFWAAFREFAAQSNPKVLLIIQAIFLALAFGAIVLTRLGHSHHGSDYVLWMYAFTFIGISGVCMALHILHDLRSGRRERVSR